MLTMAPGGRSGIFPAAPGVEKFALVVEGEASLTLGDEVHALRKADAITFIPAIPYEWINISAGPTQVVITINACCLKGQRHARVWCFRAVNSIIVFWKSTSCAMYETLDPCPQISVRV